MRNPSATRECTVQMPGGRFCGAKSMSDTPFPICGNHAYALWRRMSEMVTEAEANPSRILSLAMTDQAERKAAADKTRAARNPVVYYLLVGDLLKIGTSVNLRRRLLTYPPHRKLLAVEPGDKVLERKRHAEFRSLLASGNEWFRFEGPLVTHVERLREARAAG